MFAECKGLKTVPIFNTSKALNIANENIKNLKKHTRKQPNSTMHCNKCGRLLPTLQGDLMQVI